MVLQHEWRNHLYVSMLACQAKVRKAKTVDWDRLGSWYRRMPHGCVPLDQLPLKFMVQCKKYCLTFYNNCPLWGHDNRNLRFALHNNA